MPVDALLQRFLEDRSSLAPTELDALIAGLHDDPQLAASLREQLMLDDLLAQKFAVDRRNFEAQVAQRVADFDRGQEQLQEQVADLRAMALAEQRQGLSTGRHRGRRMALALAAILLAGFVAYAVLPIRERRAALATITAVQGEATFERDGDREPVEVDATIRDGQRIVVSRGGSLTMRYLDRTEVRVLGDTEVVFGSSTLPSLSKQIRIAHGEVIAAVKPQALGAMQFATPHAVAKVQEGELRLVVVADEHTVLDVNAGKVQFNRLADNFVTDVHASQTASFSRDALQIRQLTWPDRRDSIVFLYSRLETCEPDNDKPLMVTRNPGSRALQVTELVPHGAAQLDSRLAYEFDGGFLISKDAGPDIMEASRGRNEMTLEAVFSPASLDQAGPARIVELADDNNQPNFTLSQDGSDLTFLLRTDVDQPGSMPRLTVSSTDSPFHLTITYRSGEMVAYRDGMEVARWQDVLGSLTSWRSGPLTAGADASGERSWRGVLEAFAVYNRCLEPSEVARNARNYKLLAGRGM